jgi:hypothetical protein
MILLAATVHIGKRRAPHILASPTNTAHLVFQPDWPVPDQPQYATRKLRANHLPPGGSRNPA